MTQEKLQQENREFNQYACEQLIGANFSEVRTDVRWLNHSQRLMYVVAAEKDNRLYGAIAYKGSSAIEKTLAQLHQGLYADGIERVQLEDNA
jgi:hypothetical protein